LDIGQLSFHEVIKVFIDVLETIKQSKAKYQLLYPDVSFDNIVYVRDENDDQKICAYLIDWESASANVTVKEGGYKHLFCSMNVCRMLGMKCINE
jgi:hypothetical protein